MWFIYLPLALLCAHIIYNRIFHPLAKVPGPFLASLTDFWLAWQGYHQRRPALDLELFKKYGSVVRIRPDEVMFSNPEHFKAVYGAGTKFVKGHFYQAMQDMQQPQGHEKLDMLTEEDIEKLRLQKRYAGRVYSTENAKRHEGLIDNNLRRFLGRMKGLTKKPLDLYYEWELLLVDTMSEFTFGEEFGAVAAGSDGEHMATMERLWGWWGWIAYVPWLMDLDRKFSKWSLVFTTNMPKLPVFPFCIQKIMAYDQAAEEKKEQTSCLLDDLRKLTKEKPEFLANWGTRLALTDLGAGVDTMSWTLASVIAGIGNNQEAQAKLKAELAAAVQLGAISKSEPVSYDESAKLEYLQACMQEAMRLWPNIAISLPRDVPASGMEIDGYYIPAGYTVGMHSKVLGLNSAVFGADPEAFRPERWLEADKARRSDMETRNLAFGGPSRRCPGLHVAWLTMSKVLATFYLNFDAKLLNELNGPAGPGGHRWTEVGSFPTKWHGLEVEINEQ